MRSPGLPLAIPLVAVLLAACGTGSGASPVTATPDVANPTPVIANPTPVIASPATSSDPYWLRLSTFQAIPPLNLFGNLDEAVITADGTYVVPGAVDAIYPGPQVMPLTGRQLSADGKATIMQWAGDLGLLAGRTDFMGDGGLAGGITGQVDLTVEGGRVTLTGLPSADAADPAPGSPEAFGEFWRRVSSLPTSLPGELGPEGAYVPPAYSILVGSAPIPEAGAAAQIMDWPLDTPLATFGGPVANGTARCGTVEGSDADTLRPSIEQANQLTQWVQDPSTSATFGLTVRPLVPGEDRCREIFGPG